MKTMLALLTIFALGFTVSACGGTTGSTSSQPDSPASTGSTSPKPSPATIAPGGYWKYDGDTDPDDRGKTQGTDDEQGTLAVAPRASKVDARAIASTVRSYYAAAVTDNAAKSCSLLAASLAEALAGAQSPAHDCVAALTLLLEQQHRHFAEEQPTTMVVIEAHTRGNLGLATLGFRRMPEAQIVLLREGGTWKMGAVSDSTVP